MFLLYFCICQSILALDNEDSEEEMLQDIEEGLNVSMTVVKLLRNPFGVDVHTEVLHPSFLGALIHTSVIAILYPLHL